MKFIKDLEVRGKLVFLRNDFNVPLHKDLSITDDTRIRASLPTIKFLLENGARVVCTSHLGRPGGIVLQELSLKPVARRLAGLLNRDVAFYSETTGEVINQKKKELREGEILLLENLRFNPEERKNGDLFARELAKDIDIYVNDAFGASHRSHASIEKITQFVPRTACGILMKKEIDNLNIALHNTPKKYIVILGGAKVSDKIPLIKNLITRASAILIGGAMAYTFLKAKGVKVGASRTEDDYLPICLEILRKSGGDNAEIVLPVDHIAAGKIEPNVTVRMVGEGEEIPSNMMGYDIGLYTTSIFYEYIKKAELIFWNGPMGVFEVDSFSAGTFEIAKAIGAAEAVTIIGGGDSVSAVNQAGIADKISHISTGGGASLEFLSGKKLPGIKALS